MPVDRLAVGMTGTKTPSVSVIIPSYNHELYVRDAVESVLRSSVEDIEVIVVDDGSSDRSVSIIQGIKDPRLKLVSQKNRGAHHAMNRGLSMATGEWVAFLNSDDEFRPEKLARHLEAHAGDSRWIASASRARYFSRTGEFLPQHYASVRAYTQAVDTARGEGSLFRSLLEGNHLRTTSALFIRRDVALELGGFVPLRYAHDWFTFLSLAATGDFLVLEEPLVHYRWHPSNTIRENPLRLRLEEHFVLEWHLSAALAHEPPLLDVLEVYDILERNPAIRFDLLTLLQLWRTQNHSNLAEATEPFEAADHPVFKCGIDILRQSRQGALSRVQLEQALNSRSWAITAPLRKMHDFFQRLT